MTLLMRKYFFIFLSCVLLCAGCRHVQYVAVPSVRTEYHNSIMHDSVDRWHTHYEFLQGDTLHLIDTFYRDRLVTLFVTDSIRDTVPVIDTAALSSLRQQLAVAKSDSRRLTLWIVILAALLVAFVAYRLYRHFRPNLIWRKISE